MNLGRITRLAMDMSGMFPMGLPYEEGIPPSNAPFMVTEKQVDQPPLNWMNPFHQDENLVKSATRPTVISNRTRRLARCLMSNLTEQFYLEDGRFDELIGGPYSSEEEALGAKDGVVRMNPEEFGDGSSIIITNSPKEYAVASMV